MDYSDVEGNETAELFYRTIEALRSDGHTELAEELEEYLKSEIGTYNRALSYIKVGLAGTILVGGTFITMGGFAMMALQREPLSALAFLAFGSVLLFVTAAMLTMFRAFEESLGEDFEEQRTKVVTMMEGR